MKRIALKTYGKIIAALLSIVSFITGCEIGGETPVEYGTPSSDYLIKGKVTETDVLKPIKDIQVIRRSRWNAPHRNDTVRTAADGSYELKFEEPQQDEIVIYAEDVDGLENGGAFVTDTIRVKVSDLKQTKKRNGWYMGEFEKTDVNFKLKHETLAMYGTPTAEYKKQTDEK